VTAGCAAPREPFKIQGRKNWGGGGKTHSTEKKGKAGGLGQISIRGRRGDGSLSKSPKRKVKGNLESSL